MFFGIATSGGHPALYKAAPTRAKADQLLDARLNAPFPPTPTTCCTSGSRRATTTPPPGLERIQATLLAINSADDERNPPETGVIDRDIKRWRTGVIT